MLLPLLLAAAVAPGPTELPERERSAVELQLIARPMVGYDSGVSKLNQPAMAFEATAIVRPDFAGLELRLLPVIYTSGQQGPPAFIGGYAIVLMQILGGELGPALGVQEGAPSLGWSYRIGSDGGLRLDLLTSVVFASRLDWGGMDVSVRGPMGGGTSLVLRAGGGVGYLIAEGGVRIPAGAGVYLLPSIGFLEAGWDGPARCTGDVCTIQSTITGPQLGLGVEWLR
jgi:hypothetical protein